MMHGTTRYLLEPIIEAYAISFKRLAHLIRDLLNASRCLVRHIVVILAFPIYFLAIIFRTIVMTLAGATPRQDFPPYPTTPTHTSATPYSLDLDSPSNELSNKSDFVLFSHMVTKLSGGRGKSASVGHPRIIPPNPPPGGPDDLPPPRAIPPHLKDCEFYYNNVDIDIASCPPPLDSCGLPNVRITVDGESKTCVPGYAMTFLQSLESTRPVTVNEAGGFDLGEEKRAMLELRDRVYVGPAQWLVRVLIEEV